MLSVMGLKIHHKAPRMNHGMVSYVRVDSWRASFMRCAFCKDALNPPPPGPKLEHKRPPGESAAFFCCCPGLASRGESGESAAFMAAAPVFTARFPSTPSSRTAPTELLRPPKSRKLPPCMRFTRISVFPRLPQKTKAQMGQEPHTGGVVF